MVPSEFNWLDSFKTGAAIPAHPLALTEKRKLDERLQRALTRYYLAARERRGGCAHHPVSDPRPQDWLYEPVLTLAAEELLRSDVIRIAGVCGRTVQAIREATIARNPRYHAGVVSLSALAGASIEELIAHVRAVGEKTLTRT